MIAQLALFALLSFLAPWLLRDPTTTCLLTFALGSAAIVGLEVVVPALVPGLTPRKPKPGRKWDVDWASRLQTLGDRAVDSTAPMNLFLMSFVGAMVVHRAPVGEGPWAWALVLHAPGLVVALLLTSVLFFFTHRSLHQNKTWYKRVHAVHHEKHEPTALDAFHAHPIEILYTNLLSALLPLGVLRFDQRFCYAYLVVAILDALLAHNEYSYAPASAWIGDSRFHYLHHVLGNVNFGLKNGVIDDFYGVKREWRPEGK